MTVQDGLKDMIVLDTNKIVLFTYSSSDSNTTGLIAAVGVISNNAITLGTILSIQSGTFVTWGYLHAKALSSSSFIITYDYASNYDNFRNGNETYYVLACTVSGTTITKGTAKSITPAPYYSSHMKILPLSTTSFILYYNDATNKYSYAIPCSLSTRTITLGTMLQFSDSTIIGRGYMDGLKYDNNTFIILSLTYNNDASLKYDCAFLFTISSNTITFIESKNIKPTDFETSSIRTFDGTRIVKNNDNNIIFYSPYYSQVNGSYKATEIYFGILNLNNNHIEIGNILKSSIDPSICNTNLLSLIVLNNEYYITPNNFYKSENNLYFSYLQEVNESYTIKKAQKEDVYIKGIAKEAGESGDLINIYVPN